MPVKKSANQSNLLNISRIYHKLRPLGRQNPKNHFQFLLKLECPFAMITKEKTRKGLAV